MRERTPWWFPIMGDASSMAFPPACRALPEVVAAVNGRVEVLMDGGIRRGADVVKALCMGARAVLIGRAYAWGLAAAGGPGVARAIDILRADMIRTMRLLGCGTVRDLDRSYVDAPASWLRGSTRDQKTRRIHRRMRSGESQKLSLRPSV